MTYSLPTKPNHSTQQKSKHDYWSLEFLTSVGRYWPRMVYSILLAKSIQTNYVENIFQLYRLVRLGLILVLSPDVLVPRAEVLVATFQVLSPLLHQRSIASLIEHRRLRWNVCCLCWSCLSLTQLFSRLTNFLFCRASGTSTFSLRYS